MPTTITHLPVLGVEKEEIFSEGSRHLVGNNAGAINMGLGVGFDPILVGKGINGQTLQHNLTRG
jgi:hypothetical protein